MAALIEHSSSVRVATGTRGTFHRMANSANPANTSTGTQTNAHTNAETDTETGYVLPYNAARPTASFHALAHILMAEEVVAELGPDDDAHNNMQRLITVSGRRDLVTGALVPSPRGGPRLHALTSHDIVMPEDAAKRVAFQQQIKRKMVAMRAAAAGITDTATLRSGPIITVLATAKNGEAESWVAHVTQADDGTQHLTEWKRADVGGSFMFALHLGVGNKSGVRKLAKREGIPARIQNTTQPRLRHPG